LIATTIAIIAVISIYLLFSANVVPTGVAVTDQKQTAKFVNPKAHQVPASKPIRPASKTTALTRSGPPSKRF
jgi:hypothetical protein